VPPRDARRVPRRANRRDLATRGGPVPLRRAVYGTRGQAIDSGRHGQNHPAS
jgi:hypothetical protein